MLDEPLFKSAHAAVAFALNYSLTEHIERSPASKMADPSKGQDKGLGGYAGAAQAGMILAELNRLGEFYESCVIARVAKPRLLCNCNSVCCSRYKPNFQRLDAINTIAMEVKKIFDTEREDGKRGMVDNPAMRRAIIAKFFGDHIKVKDLAKACEVTDDTIANHTGKINRILKRSEGEAWDRLVDLLRYSGITN